MDPVEPLVVKLVLNILFKVLRIGGQGCASRTPQVEMMMMMMIIRIMIVLLIMWAGLPPCNDDNDDDDDCVGVALSAEQTGPQGLRIFPTLILLFTLTLIFPEGIMWAGLPPCNDDNDDDDDCVGVALSAEQTGLQGLRIFPWFFKVVSWFLVVFYGFVG